MAKFNETEQFNTIEATGLNGEKVALRVWYNHEAYSAMVTHSFMVVPPVKKSTYEIIDVSGCKDGAGSLVKMQWHRSRGLGEREEVAIRETPAQLREVFAQAGVTMPATSKSWGRVFRDIRDGIFGKPKDPSIDPS